MTTTPKRLRQQGFGLVELMIAMTLGLILIGGVGYLYIGSRGAFRTSDNLSRMQENGRYALEVMSRDIRMAGYAGCGNMASVVMRTIANPPVPTLNAQNAIVDYDNGAGWANPTAIIRSAGDVLAVMAAYSNGVNLTGNLAPANANIQIAGNPDNFKQGDVLTVTNCQYADVFKVTNVPGHANPTTLTHANSSNNGNRVGTYGPDAFVMRVDQRTYFIGSNPAGNRALYRVGLDGVAEELVEHVYDMQFVYGLDNNADGTADQYVAAPTAAQLPTIVSVRVNLLMESRDDNIATAAQTVVFNNGNFNAPDRRLYQVFSATVSVRNRLPAS